MQPRQCFNAANVRVRIGFKRLRAERAAERDHPFAVFDAGEPFTARDGFLANGTLHVCSIYVAGVVVGHNVSSCLRLLSVVVAALRRRERHRKKMAGYTTSSMTVEVTTPPIIG